MFYGRARLASELLAGPKREDHGSISPSRCSKLEHSSGLVSCVSCVLDLDGCFAGFGVQCSKTCGAERRGASVGHASSLRGDDE